ncbi:CLE16 protein [Sesbania bispinosa]|nr:CLE16 protein [Sesbania bispinosa]
MGVVYVLLVLLIFCNSGFIGIAGALFNFTRYASRGSNISSNSEAELEDKRGVPSGANPLHNR